MQIRQNTNTGKAQVIQATADRATRAWMMIIQNPHLADAMQRANSGGDLTAMDHLTLNSMAMVLMRNYEASLRTEELGLMEAGALEGARLGMATVLTRPYYASWWDENRNRFARSFCDQVDRLTAEQGAGS